MTLLSAIIDMLQGRGTKSADLDKAIKNQEIVCIVTHLEIKKQLGYDGMKNVFTFADLIAWYKAQHEQIETTEQRSPFLEDKNIPLVIHPACVSDLLDTALMRIGREEKKVKEKNLQIEKVIADLQKTQQV